ncbi:hypothetical protein L1049_000273 [Liquidambar formosana]|uniref:Uncharacterized protein n=1 Tax=Liquidambar formosana TaxID=63359 RepID=A0AAP0NB54_LIQFO
MDFKRDLIRSSQSEENFQVLHLELADLVLYYPSMRLKKTFARFSHDGITILAKDRESIYLNERHDLSLFNNYSLGEGTFSGKMVMEKSNYLVLCNVVVWSDMFSWTNLILCELTDPYPIVGIDLQILARGGFNHICSPRANARKNYCHGRNASCRKSASDESTQWSHSRGGFVYVDSVNSYHGVGTESNRYVLHNANGFTQ